MRRIQARFAPCHSSREFLPPRCILPQSFPPFAPAAKAAPPCARFDRKSEGPSALQRARGRATLPHWPALKLAKQDSNFPPAVRARRGERQQEHSLRNAPRTRRRQKLPPARK